MKAAIARFGSSGAGCCHVDSFRPRRLADQLGNFVQTGRAMPLPYLSRAPATVATIPLPVPAFSSGPLSNGAGAHRGINRRHGGRGLEYLDQVGSRPLPRDDSRFQRCFQYL